MSKIDSGRIFVSYRRQDTPHVAGRLFDRLAKRFGGSHVFMDIASIEPGFDFAKMINEAVSGCDVLLALIGQRWLSAVDDHGRRRLDNPDDLVLLEVKTALEQNIRVIPVLVDGASAPRRDELPGAIADLTRRNWVRLDHETFDSDVAVLMNVLDRIISPGSGRSAAGSCIVEGQDDGAPGDSAGNFQPFHLSVGDFGAQSQAALVHAEDAASTDPTQKIQPIRTASKWAVPATLAIALAVLTVPAVIALIIDSKQISDTLGILGLLLFFLMIAGVTTIWILYRLTQRGKIDLKSFWVAGSALVLLLVVVPGLIVVPRLVDFWGNVSPDHPVSNASPVGAQAPSSLSSGPPPLWPGGKSPMLVKTVDVQAVGDWRDTGVFLEEGQTARIVASGQWSPFSPKLFDGRGCLDVALCSQDPNQSTNICCMPHGGLLGRIGGTNPFAVGVGTLLQVPNRGELYFRINDLVQSDNSGQLTVTIQVFN